MRKNKKIILLGFLILVSLLLIGISSASTCTDTDGKDAYTKGKVSGTFGSTPYTTWDFCSPDGNKVSEQYCTDTDGDGVKDWAVGEWITCLSGCTDGACITTFSCSDSDGKDYKNKGTVTTIYNGHSTTYNDACPGTEEVKEFYCKDNWVAYETKDCKSYGEDYSCVDGLCKQTDIPEELCEFWKRKYEPGKDACVFKDENKDCNWHFIFGHGYHFYYCSIKDSNAVFWTKTDNECNMLETNFKCGSGESCYGGDCVESCTDNSDCKEDEVCEQGEAAWKVCKPIPPEPKCESCDAFALSTLLGSFWKEKQCNGGFVMDGLIPKYFSFTTCFFSFIRFLLIPIVFIFSLLFGKDIFSGMKSIRRKEGVAWILSLIVAGILAYIVYVSFWIGVVIFIIYIAFKLFVGGKISALKSAVRSFR